MKYLLRKEISLFFSSPMGYVIISVWLLAVSCMLWIFPGEYNIPDSGYATLYPFFSLAPVLFLFLVPAVTMRTFAEEKRMGTLELLIFRPVKLSKIVLSKYFSACLVMLIAVIPTFLYVWSVELMSHYGLDMGETLAGYAGILLLLIAWVAIGIFASSITSNQLVAFLLGIACMFTAFYGFDLVASLFSEGSLYHFVTGLGMRSHYRTLIKGIVDSRDVVYFLGVACLFLFLAASVLNRKRIGKIALKGGALLLALILVYVMSAHFFVRLDGTAEKRYTLSLPSRELAANIERPLQVVIYLNGSLNPAFYRLRSAALDLLEEFAQYMPQEIMVREINPNLATNETFRQQNYQRMEEKGMKGITVNERDREGKISSKVVFPWMEVIYDSDTLSVPLLQRSGNLSPQAQMNASVEVLEYSLVNALRVLTTTESERIAFIEGHGEWTEPYVYEAVESLSRYYSVDRGVISGKPEELFPYKVLIIASPKKAFSEAQKFALDQYMMQGGSLLVLMDGVQISSPEFEATGESATLKQEVNLDDLLFTYGVRVNPVTVQDMNCTMIRVAASETGTEDTYKVLPWYFSPLLQPQATHSITHHISPLRSELVSTVSLVGKDSLKKTILLSTSDYTHTLPVPEKISLRYVEMPASPEYFNEKTLPVAALVEGTFPSVFKNRLLPDGASEPQMGRQLASKPARLIVVASGSIIKNEWRGKGAEAYPLALGYDPITGDQLGNGDFLINAVNYLAGNEKWLSLRNRSHRLRLLDKQEITFYLLRWQLLNVGVPLILLLLGGITYRVCRKRKYISR